MSALEILYTFVTFLATYEVSGWAPSVLLDPRRRRLVKSEARLSVSVKQEQRSS